MTSKKFKIFSSIIITIIAFTLTSCKKEVTINSFSEMDKLIYEAVLNEDGRYLVFIYGNTCSACEELEPTIAKYATLAKNKQKKYIPLFVLNSSNTRVNKDLIASGGDDSFEDFKGTTNYKDIRIATTPALLIIENHTVVKYISTKVTNRPKSEIREYFLELMN